VITLALTASELAFVLACVMNGGAIMASDLDSQRQTISRLIFAGQMLGNDAGKALIDRLNAGAIAVVTGARTAL